MLGSLGARARGMSCFGEALGTLLRLPAGAANDSEVLPLLAASRIWEPGLMAFKKKKKRNSNSETLRLFFFICCLVCC